VFQNLRFQRKLAFLLLLCFILQILECSHLAQFRFIVARKEQVDPACLTHLDGQICGLLLHRDGCEDQFVVVLRDAHELHAAGDRFADAQFNQVRFGFIGLVFRIHVAAHGRCLDARQVQTHDAVADVLCNRNAVPGVHLQYFAVDALVNRPLQWLPDHNLLRLCLVLHALQLLFDVYGQVTRETGYLSCTHGQQLFLQLVQVLPRVVQHADQIPFRVHPADLHAHFLIQ